MGHASPLDEEDSCAQGTGACDTFLCTLILRSHLSYQTSPAHTWADAPISVGECAHFRTFMWICWPSATMLRHKAGR
jgi:hypothetical protein